MKRIILPILLIATVLLGACASTVAPRTSEVTPTLTPPVITDFSASPAEISAGESATLHWEVTNAITISIDQGIGNVPLEGTEEVSPATTIAYTLTASNDKGTVTKSVKVIVTKPKGIPWNEAKYHIGEKTTVYGPVVSATWASGSKGKPTFLNVGKPYPNPDRLTVVIWIDCRANFPQAPEKYYLHKTIYVTGLIVEYKGVAEIEVCYPSEIQEQ